MISCFDPHLGSGVEGAAVQWWRSEPGRYRQHSRQHIGCANRRATSLPHPAALHQIEL